MCTADKLSEDYCQILKDFKDSFEICYELFDMNMTLKIHIIIDHYEDFFRMTGKTMKNINGEHHEAIHHLIKDFERKRGFYMRKSLGGLIHMQKSLQSISTFNCLRLGFAKKSDLRIRKSSLSVSGDPFSTPKKGFNFSHSFILSKVTE